MRQLFTNEQLGYLSEMEKACGECETWIQALEGLGIQMDDRRAHNEFRRVSCQRCREVEQQYRAGKFES